MGDQLRDDQYYLDMIRAGDMGQGLEGLWAKYHHDLLRFCEQKCRDFKQPIDLAHDFATDTWLKEFVPRVIKEPVRESVGGLLRTMAARRIYRASHRKDIEHNIEYDIVSDLDIEDSLLRRAEQLEAQQILDVLYDERLVETLAACQRMFLILRYGFDLPPRTISLLTGRDTNTISVYITKAKAKVREYIDSIDFRLRNKPEARRAYQLESLINIKLPFEWKSIQYAYCLLPVGYPFRLSKICYLVHFPHDELTGFGRRFDHTLCDAHISNNEVYLINPRDVRVYVNKNEEERKERMRNHAKQDAPMTDSLEVFDSGEAYGWTFNFFAHETEKIYPAFLTNSDMNAQYYPHKHLDEDY